MTVIAVKDRAMASDSASFLGSLVVDENARKIYRSRNGLFAATGEANDCYRVGLWFEGGEDPAAKPEGLRSGADGISGLILRPNGRAWLIDDRLSPHPCGQAATSVGGDQVVSFVEGAMAAGASAEEAVRLALPRCNYIGGFVQVERLDG